VSLRISKRKSVTAPKRTLIASSVRSPRRVTAQEAREANAQIYATVTKSAMAPRATKQALKVEKALNLKFKGQEQQEIKETATMKIARVKRRRSMRRMRLKGEQVDGPPWKSIPISSRWSRAKSR